MIKIAAKSPLARAALLALTMAGSLTACAAVNGQESGKEYISDASITTKVKANIINEQSLKGFEIHVETMKGTVQLSGFVDNAAQKAQAGQIANAVSGVQAVSNNIQVRQPS